mmetsp:Transcript_93754/g.147464  ORF Transcript_93754/g.147464 Transcript_93754/m.147464 type:complete len:155 (-) Transcript_93754:262-726(-)
MAPSGNGRSRAESPTVRNLSEKENLTTSETNKPLIVEKVQIQSKQTKSSRKDETAAEKSSRCAVVKSYACNRKILLSLLSIACVVAIGAAMVLWKADLSFALIVEAFPDLSPWLFQKQFYRPLGLIVFVAVATMIPFRKSLAKRLPRPFAKKQA